MPRRDRTISVDRTNCIITVESVESFTLRMQRDDGVWLYSDGADFWRAGGMSWYGEAPLGWDASDAESGNWEFTTGPVELDRS